MAQTLWAQTPSEDFLKHQAAMSAESYGFRGYVSKILNRKKKLSTTLFLHGNGVNGTDNEQQVQGINETVYKNSDLFDFIIIFPQARLNTVWIGEMMTQAVKALDQTVEEFNGDPKRFFLSSFSMDSYGTPATDALNLNKFAALVHISGVIVPPFELLQFIKMRLPQPARFKGSQFLLSPRRTNRKNDGQVVHGFADESIAVTESRKISEALRSNENKNFFCKE